MAKNHDYYTLAHNYALKIGLDRTDAESVATTLSVLIPLHHNWGSPDEPLWADNQHVLDSFNKLHQGRPYTRLIPDGLSINIIRVETYDDLPKTTTYGQLYHIKQGGHLLETRPNGQTESVNPRIRIAITEPIATNPVLLDALREKAKQKGLEIVVWDKDADHPDNVIGLAKMRALFADNPDQMLKIEASLRRAEDQSCWSKPTGKIKFRNRPSNTLTRMRNRQRRG
ncbi:hypothetical protein ACSA002_2640 [Salmonella phage vB_SalM_SA002]|nr:hypothetical protein ACSA002_2640 [Salmonella phage vB_SalM_SA002]